MLWGLRRKIPSLQFHKLLCFGSEVVAASGHGKSEMIQLSLPTSERGIRKEKFTDARHNNTPTQPKIWDRSAHIIPLQQPLQRGQTVFKSKICFRRERKLMKSEQRREKRKKVDVSFSQCPPSPGTRISSTTAGVSQCNDSWQTLSNTLLNPQVPSPTS